MFLLASRNLFMRILDAPILGMTNDAFNLWELIKRCIPSFEAALNTLPYWHVPYLLLWFCSIGSILGCRAEILQLDVTDIKMECFLTQSGSLTLEWTVVWWNDRHTMCIFNWSYFLLAVKDFLELYLFVEIRAQAFYFGPRTLVPLSNVERNPKIIYVEIKRIYFILV